MDFVGLRGVQRQQLAAQAVGVGEVTGTENPDLAAGAYFREHCVDTVEAGARHETDVTLGLMRWNCAQSSAARLVPRSRPSLSDQLAVCWRNRARWAAASGGDPGSLTDKGLYGVPAI